VSPETISNCWPQTALVATAQSGCNEDDTVRDLRIALCDLQPTAIESELSVEIFIKIDAEEPFSA